MVGVDYSEQSVLLARKLWKQYSTSVLQVDGVKPESSISFEVYDLIRDDPATSPWWPYREGGFDLVLDKGTFDAISLSSETVMEAGGRRLFEIYPAKIAGMIRPGGFFLITSCNWTQDEVIRWFTTGDLRELLTIYHVIKYPTFQFGGQTGQGVVSICFRKIKTL
jgi:EEF1A lysine methyltransferase 2